MFTARVEAVGHDGHDTAAVLERRECRHEMRMGRERIFGAGSVSGEGRIHDYDRRPHGYMLVDLRGVEGGDAAFREEISKNRGSHLVQFIELKHFRLARPLGERPNAGTRFENNVFRSNNGKVVYEPRQMQRRREMLMRDLLFAADRLRGESFFEFRELVDQSALAQVFENGNLIISIMNRRL